MVGICNYFRLLFLDSNHLMFAYFMIYLNYLLRVLIQSINRGIRSGAPRHTLLRRQTRGLLRTTLHAGPLPIPLYHMKSYVNLPKPRIPWMSLQPPLCWVISYNTVIRLSFGVACQASI